jgi:hypothetical protein
MELIGGLVPHVTPPCSAGDVGPYLDNLRATLNQIPATVLQSNEYVALASLQGVLSLLDRDGCRHFGEMRHRRCLVPEGVIRQPSDAACQAMACLIKSMWRTCGADHAPDLAARRLQVSQRI